MKNLNTKSEGDNGYVAMFNGQQVGIYAPTLLKAKELALAHFKPRKAVAHRVYVMIAERADGSEVVHTPDF